MNRINQIFLKRTFMKQVLKEEQKMLGRWAIEKCQVKLNNKIDLSNHDHCGPCGLHEINYIQENENDVDSQIRFVYMV
jgi:hypothetical protein